MRRWSFFGAFPSGVYRVARSSLPFSQGIDLSVISGPTDARSTLSMQIHALPRRLVPRRCWRVKDPPRQYQGPTAGWESRPIAGNGSNRGSRRGRDQGRTCAAWRSISRAAISARRAQRLLHPTEPRQEKLLCRYEAPPRSRSDEGFTEALIVPGYY